MFVLSFVIPRHGTTVPLCWVQGLVGLPCPGCGMSRSFANISQLYPADAWGYHPFGLVFYPLVVALALANLLPRQRLADVRRWLEARERSLRPAYFSIVAAFIAFGAVRFVIEAFARGPSPGWG